MEAYTSIWLPALFVHEEVNWAFLKEGILYWNLHNLLFQRDTIADSFFEGASRNTTKEVLKIEEIAFQRALLKTASMVTSKTAIKCMAALTGDHDKEGS